METRKTYMAVNQYGDTVHGLIHPRKELMERHGVKHAENMYIDGKDGKTYHIGYIVSGCWYNIYRVFPMRKAI